MKGIDISREYFLQYGKPMLDSEFADIKHLLAAGLVGSGSECYGFDDDISKDHDFEPGFYIFVPDELNEKAVFKLQRAYDKLPQEFMGIKRNSVAAVGGRRNGVKRISDFYLEKIGSKEGELEIGQALTIPDYALYEATNGEVFFDSLGRFSAIREKIKNRDESVRLKKIAGNLLLMAQSGQYNYQRCIKRGETAAAQLAAFEFSKSALQLIFLLNKSFMPYYKWCFKAARQIDSLGICDSLEFLISSDNSSKTAALKCEIIEDVSRMISDELRALGLTNGQHKELELHAYEVNGSIKDVDIRNQHILCGV